MYILDLIFLEYLQFITRCIFIMQNKFNIAIVGGGVVGLATAYQLQTNFPD